MGRNHSVDSTHYGDELCTKREGICRVVMMNPHGLRPRHNSPKMEKIKAFLFRHKIDLFGISESNVDWCQMNTKCTLWGRMDGWFEALKISIAHNREAPRLKRCQEGGMAMIATNKMAYCVKSCGGDERKLGRWTWMTLRGNNGIKTRVVTVYGLNKPTNDPDDHTCYHTQRRCLEEKNI